MLPEDVKVRLPSEEVVTIRTAEDSGQTFYVNNATFSYTQWDITVNLNEILVTKQEDPGSVILLVSRKAKVIMNVAYAKLFAQVLLSHVEKHEAIGKQTAAEQTAAEPEASSETALPADDKPR